MGKGWWKPVFPRNKPGRAKGCKPTKNYGKRKQLNPDWNGTE